jgi:hypothetical protein
MTEPKQKGEVTWLQCMVSRAEWDAINARRLALNLTWKDIVLPGTLVYLTQLEANPPAPKQPEPKEAKAKNKKAK